MVDTTTVTVRCPSCGAENLGTRFCESCGAPAPALVRVAVIAPLVTAEPLPATGSTGSGWRIALLIVFIVSHVIPPLIEAGIRATGSFDPVPARWITTAFLVVLGIVGLIAVGSGPRAAGAGRAVGVVLVLVAVGLEIAYAFVGMLWPEPLQIAAIVAVFVLWFIAWAASAALAPRAYAGLAVLAVAVVMQVLVPLLLVLSGVWNSWALTGSTTAATIVLTLAVVGITRAIDRTAPIRRADPVPATAALSTSEVPPGQVLPLANVAFRLGIGAIGAIVLSILLALLPIPGVLGLVISVAYLGLVVGAIVTGHVARSRIRRGGGGGRDRALAGMVIGYCFVGLTVAGIVAQLVSWQITMQALNAASYDYSYENEGTYGEDYDDEGVFAESEENGVQSLGVTCTDLFSQGVVSAANSAGLVLNPAWADGTDPGGLSLQDPELAAVLASTPSLDCRWLSPNGGSGVGIRSVIAVVDADQAAWLNGRFAALGYRPQNELGGTRYFFEANAGGTPYGESHIVREGIWFATHWLSYGPKGYTADMVTNYFG